MGWTKNDLVREAGLLAVSGLGWTESDLPGMEPGMMGLRGVPGLNIVRRVVVPKTPAVGSDEQASKSNNVLAG